MFVPHAFALHLEDENILGAGDIAQRDGLRGLHGFNGLAGGDAPHERQGQILGRLALEHAADGQHVNGAAAVVVALEQPFFLQVGDVFVHGGQRTQAQAVADLFKRRRIAVPLDEFLEKVVNLALSFSDCHNSEILTNQRRICNINCSKGESWL